MECVRGVADWMVWLTKSIDKCNGRANKSMDVRAKHLLCYQRGFFNSELCVIGFAPRHLNR